MTVSKQQVEQQFATGEGMISIVINQQAHQVGYNLNLQQIINQFELGEKGYVFAINNKVIPRNEWASTVISQGDSISLFQAIAGG